MHTMPAPRPTARHNHHRHEQLRGRVLRRRRHRIRAALLLAGLSLLLTACGGDGGGEPDEEPTAAVAEDVEDAHSAALDAAPAGAAPDPAPPEPPEDGLDPLADPLADLGPVQVARATGHLDVHDRPGDAEPTRTLPATTDFGSTTVVLVIEVGVGDDAGWLEVLLPGRPNGATGWIRAADVELRDVEVAVHVDLARRKLTVHADGEAILDTEVAIGDAEHPTPTGRFFVTDKLDTGEPDGAYGPYALGLSGRSEVLTEFAGGDGQLGIHGTNDPTSIGEAVSHGCVRVPNAVVRELVTLLPLGTPVVIS